jgi:hypothetical protein
MESAQELTTQGINDNLKKKRPTIRNEIHVIIKIIIIFKKKL